MPCQHCSLSLLLCYPQFALHSGMVALELLQSQNDLPTVPPPQLRFLNGIRRNSCSFHTNLAEELNPKTFLTELKEPLIGRGAYAEVYKGQLADGSLVAVRRCEPCKPPALSCAVSSRITGPESNHTSESAPNNWLLKGSIITGTCRNEHKIASLPCISIYWLMEQWLIVYGSTCSTGNRLDCCPLSTGQHRCPSNKE